MRVAPASVGAHHNDRLDTAATQAASRPSGGVLDDVLLLTGLSLLSIQFVQIGGAQLGQMWAIVMLALLIVRGKVSVSGWEALVYALFIGVALWLTVFSGYPRMKDIQQIIKFVVVYPGFFLIGRYFGRHYSTTRLPFGYAILGAYLLFEIALQKFNVPFLYQKVDFMQDAMHGSFLERNWFAFFFFGASYVVFLQSSRRPADVVAFVAFGVLNALLSESKTVLIPCGIVMLAHLRGHNGVKLLVLAAGAALYVFRFGNELSGQMLDVRVEEERGLAFSISMGLVARDWLGYGLGFVESYFAHAPLEVKGLGEGTNSVFCSPLDLMLIAGVPGVLLWLVFFCGFGLGWATMLCLAPIAAWSLTNPMHQSEIVYLYLGYLVSWGRRQPATIFAVRKPRRALRLAGEPVQGDTT